MKTTIDEAEDWFRLFQEGKEDAFRQVFEKYYRPISFFAQKILKDDIAVEDVVSETFRKAWDCRARFETVRHLHNFMYLVTRNACISELRAGRMTQSTAEEWGRLADNGQEPNSALDLERVQTRLIEAVYEKLEKMPGGEVLRMSFLEGKTTKEIASQLEISENNVYIIKSRSLKALRTMLTGNEWMLFLFLLLNF